MKSFRTLLVMVALGALGTAVALSPSTDADAKAGHPPKGPLKGWVKGFTITEYYPASESWFAGPKKTFPGIAGKHRVSWLLSAYGVSMEGDGWSSSWTGPGSKWASWQGGSDGWINSKGRRTSPGGPLGWTNGSPAWLGCGWKNKKGKWTFPGNFLSRGAEAKWANGKPKHWVGCPNTSFGYSHSTSLRFWNSVAVDPGLFPRGRTWFYVPAYRNTRCNGWFRADDTGAAISGLHLDIYRPPPSGPTGGHSAFGKKVLIKRGSKPKNDPCK